MPPQRAGSAARQKARSPPGRRCHACSNFNGPRPYMRSRPLSRPRREGAGFPSTRGGWGGGPVHGRRRDGIGGIGLTGHPDHGGRQGRLSVAADDLEVRLSKSVRVVGPNGPRAGREAPPVLPDGDGRISKSGPLPGRSKFILSFLDMYTLLLNFFSTFLQRCQF